MILREQRNEGTEKRQSDNGAVIRQGPGSSSRDTHNNIPLSSAGTKALTQLEDGKMPLTLLTFIN